MRKYIFTSIASVLLACNTYAQNISTVFLNIPKEIFIELDAESKGKLVATQTDSTKTVSVDAYLGSIERLAISDDFIALKTSKSGTLQIKLLPLINNSKIICLIKTVCGKACDSQIYFYTTDWKPISNDLFPVKSNTWFISDKENNANDDFNNAFAAIDMNPIKLSLSEKDNTIVAEYEIESYLSEEDMKKIKPFLTSTTQTFNWNKTSFK